MRTFIAIEVPKEIKNTVEIYVNPLKKEKAKISWVKPENIHITLKFLGEVTEDKIPEIFEHNFDHADSCICLSLELLMNQNILLG